MDQALLPLPPVFVSHGSPMTALEPGAAGAFFEQLGPAIDAAFGRPQAIVAVSAHTRARLPVLLAAARHEAVYDFGGFDERLYRLRYDAPGAPALAARVQALLAAAGIDAQRVDQGGLDHGIWTPLRYAYPAAEVPLLPLALPADWPAPRLFALGEALAALPAQRVWLLATGGITHNLQRVFAHGLHPRDDEPEVAPSREFRAWFAQRSAERDWPALLAWREQAPHALDMHPSDEHLLPWFVAAGAGGSAHPPLRLHASVTAGSLGMDAYAFGAQAAVLQAALADRAAALARSST